MKSAVTCIVVLINVLHLAAGNNNCHLSCKKIDSPDYYWRDYKGVIPPDPVPGGVDRAGFATYIGQSLILPYGQRVGSIYQNNQTVPGTADGKTLYADKSIKILCSGNKKKFRWIATNTNKIQLITHCQLPLGGIDRGQQLNIGRINYNDEIVVGKVMTTTVTWDGLWVPNNGAEKQFRHFEVLAYDCKPLLDIRAAIIVE